MNYIFIIFIAVLILVIVSILFLGITYSLRSTEDSLCFTEKELTDPTERKLSNAPVQYLWPNGSTIKIYIYKNFINYPMRYQTEGDAAYEPLYKKYKNIETGDEIVEAIKDIIKNRFEPIVNLQFEFVDDAKNSDVRIELGGNISYSKLGISALRVPKSKHTMQLRVFDVAVVMHEFGHALGLFHEHQHPNAPPIIWNEENLIKHAKTLGINENSIKNNFTETLDTPFVGTDYDEKSIMKYSLEKDLIKNENKEPFTRRNYILSKKDIEGLNKMYQ